MTRPEEPLAARLRGLRTSAGLTQKAIGNALRVSVPLLSSWESGKAIPPQARLDAFAVLFALDLAPGAGVKPPLPEPGVLSGPEQERYRVLLRELTDLRGGGAASVHPLCFAPGDPVTVVCSKLDDDRRSKIGYADLRSPDYVDSYKYADLDALIALLPHVGTLNPTSLIVVDTWDALSADDLRAHLVALGGVDFNMLMRETLKSLTDLPVSQLGRETDDDIGGFRIRDRSGHSREVRPRLDGKRLVEDVAHFLRAPNPFNTERTITFFGGMYSRGSLGVVRALTEPGLKDRNAGYLADRFRGATTYSIVSRVPVFADAVIVPDWTQPDIRLHEWPPA